MDGRQKMDGLDPDRRDGGKLSRSRLRKRTGCHGNQTDGSASFYCAMIIINNQNLKEKPDSDLESGNIRGDHL